MITIDVRAALFAAIFLILVGRPVVDWLVARFGETANNMYGLLIGVSGIMTVMLTAESLPRDFSTRETAKLIAVVLIAGVVTFRLRSSRARSREGS